MVRTATVIVPIVRLLSLAVSGVPTRNASTRDAAPPSNGRHYASSSARVRQSCRLSTPETDPRRRVRPSSRPHAVFDMGDPGPLDSPDLLERELGPPQVVEEASAVPEQHWDDVQLELGQQPRRQVLVDDLGAAPEHDVFAVGGLPRLLERGLDPARDEVVGGPAFHLHGFARVMGDDEHLIVVRGVVSPPTLPLLIAPVPATYGPEHVSAHHPSADVRP